ncbi:gp16 family protein [Erythrobacter sp. NE805]|uniref:gp16 family protein n=1 Tax=Erythrobacter sp. NE805 TaxID=3389875 RepID=UPI00396B25BF
MALSLVSTAPARPARFDPRTKRRNAMIGKVHVGKKALSLDEDDYRQILIHETGKASLKDCSERELEMVLDRFRALGWKDLPRPAAKGVAQNPMARKARALWISLYHLGWARNRDEKALEAFAKRQIGCERLVWAKQSDGYKLIEALKKRAEIEGWAQTDASGNNLSPLKLNEGLCEAILAKLVKAGEARPDWTLNTAAWRLCGVELGADGPMNAEAYQTLAQQLGARLRAAGGAA